MTDERADASLIRALHRLPRGAGVVFRHYATPVGERERRLREVRAIARRRGLVLLLADTAERAKRWGADGVHGRVRPKCGLLRTASAHDTRELRYAGADLVFLSPVFPTRSHPDAKALGPMRFATLIRHARVPVVALGGMTLRRGRQLQALGAWGWAAIDAWS